MSTPTNAAFVEVDQFFQGTTTVASAVAPSQFKLIPIGQLKAGDQFAVQVDAANKVYNDITACVATESEARSYTPKGQCRGQIRTKTPIVLKEQAAADGSYFIILDNSYAALITKQLTVTITTRKALAPAELANIKGGLERVQASMTAMFEGSDFNLIVKPCGQSNAFSDNKTADITVCTEFMHDMSVQKNTGAMVAVLLHEYGHSLLNKWGEPGSSEEDMADQFATALLLRSGDNGRRLLQDWIGFWVRQDSQAEAQNQIKRGDTHTLSIQRARNIQTAMNFPDDFTRRWNKMLYRHMTRDALAKIVAKPNKVDDIELAVEALRLK